MPPGSLLPPRLLCPLCEPGMEDGVPMPPLD